MGERDGDIKAERQISVYLIFIKAHHFEGDRGERERPKERHSWNGVHMGVEQRGGGWQGEKDK